MPMRSMKRAMVAQAFSPALRLMISSYSVRTRFETAQSIMPKRNPSRSYAEGMLDRPRLNEHVRIDANRHALFLWERYSRTISGRFAQIPAACSRSAWSDISWRTASFSFSNQSSYNSATSSSDVLAMRFTICSRRFFGTGSTGHDWNLSRFQLGKPAPFSPRLGAARKGGSGGMAATNRRGNYSTFPSTSFPLLPDFCRLRPSFSTTESLRQARRGSWPKFLFQSMIGGKTPSSINAARRPIR